MPEHTSFFTYLIAKFPILGELAHSLGPTLFGHKPVTAHTIEPFVVSIFIVLILVVAAFLTRAKIAQGPSGVADSAILPEDKLTTRTFLELFVSTVYDTMKDAMGAKRAKRYFPVVGTAAAFVFFGNLLGLIPGFAPPTSSWNITLGSALVVFFAFNYYGLKENGFGYIKHLAGPVWWLAFLIFPLELMSLLIRPITLSVRLMLNMSVDHLLVSIFHSLVVLVIPVVIMLLGTLVIAVQAYVFTLLSTVYIALATEHEEHVEDHQPGKKHDITQIPLQPPA
ncbi:F0F1 ATP synthase subunit A [Pendulispora albinea]|uniref:ATP synthase subunit a n=1 Tax=Pendulispora albinea TaxID=2741071 RepID=A0ABZ2LWY6_9BACT